MSDLDWITPDQSRRKDLETFLCTAPTPRVRWSKRELPHPKPWERLVQVGIRTNMVQALSATGPPHGHYMRCGYVDGRLVAVGWAEQMAGPGQVFVKACAVSCDVRGSGGSVARELHEELLNDVRSVAAAAGLTEVVLRAKVDPRNIPSQTLLLAAGWRKDGMDEGLELWRLDDVFGDPSDGAPF